MAANDSVLMSARPVATPRVALGAVALAVSYYLAAKLGEALAFPSAPVSALWAPNAIVFAALLLTPVRRWWIYLLAVLPAHILAQIPATPPAQVAIQYVVNCAEALLGAAALLWLESQPRRFDTLSAMANLILVGGILSPFATSLAMAAAFAPLGLTNDVWLTTIARTATNTFAVLTLVPLIVHAAARTGGERPRIPWSLALEVLALAACLIIVGLIVFVSPGTPQGHSHALLYAPLPLLLWAAVRLGTSGVCAAVLIIGALSTWGVLQGNGPFVEHLPVQNALSLVIFLNVTCVPLLLLAAVLQERKETAAALRGSEVLHRAVLASVQDQIAVLDRDGVVLQVNDSWKRAFAGSTLALDGLLPGRNYLAANAAAADRGDQFCATVCEALQAVLSGANTRLELEFALSGADGTRWFDQSIESLQRPEGGAVITISDVTARRRAELEVQEQHQQLAHLSRVTMLGEFSGAIAHEITQPLTAILSNAEAAVRFLDAARPDIDGVREILPDIVGNSLRAVSVLQRLRSMLRNDETQRRPLELNELAAEILALARGDLARRRILARTHFGRDLPRVSGDRVQIQQVILNLVVNACEAMADVPEERRLLEVTTRGAAPAEVEIMIRNRGAGVDDSLLQVIFQPFVTTKRNGLGLGLAISNSIARAHRGRLWVENVADGVVFHLTLPIVESQTSSSL